MAGKRVIETEIELRAIDFRQQNGYSSTEPVHLKSLLLKRNVLSVFRPLTSDFSGMALKVGSNLFMMVNTEQSQGKQHFTIAHELYHLCVQDNFTFQQCKTGRFDRKDIEEYKADLFAAFFLLPSDGIKKMIPPEELGRNSEISLQTVLKIEQFYSVSRSALLYRLKSLGLINSGTYDKYARDVIRSAVYYGYPVALYKRAAEQSVIGDYGVLAQQLFSTGEISESHYYELMDAIGVNPLEIREEAENGF
jgi:Zn-dependent peptidase ImmA (M78 family)